MSNVLTGYFSKPHDLPRSKYISNNKIDLALDGTEYCYALYGEGIQRPVTPQMEYNKMLHQATLEPEIYQRNRFIRRFDNMNSKEAQDWLKRIQRENPGARIVSPAESLKVDRIVDKIMSHSVAGEIIRKSKKEMHGYAICPRTGSVLYSRPDLLTIYGQIGDLKFVRSVDEFWFNREQWSMGWYRQIAFYSFVDALIHSIVRPLTNCFFIAVEPVYPHKLAIIQVDPDYIKIGDAKWNRGMDLFLECLARDPEIKNPEAWRVASNEVKHIKPEFFMTNNDPLLRDLMGMGA